jgi:hypothetical protein
MRSLHFRALVPDDGHDKTINPEKVKGEETSEFDMNRFEIVMIANNYVIPAKAGIHFEMIIVISFHQTGKSTERKNGSPLSRG